MGCAFFAGDYLLVASQDADSVEVLKIDNGGGTGGLERVDTAPVNCAADVAVF